MSKHIRDAVRTALALSAAALLLPLAALGQDAAAETSAQADESARAQGEGPLEEVVVVGRQRAAVTDVMKERIEQEVVVDLLGVEQISRVGDSTVSAALRRLPGITLVSDKFIYIRGLGERYSSTTLNGAQVPSPDLTRNVIPLDLFPAEIIQSLAVNKGFSPDMPAAFGGGNVDIRTIGLPEEFVFDLQVGSGWNTNASGDALTYPGGDDDWQGKDDGTRALSSEIEEALQTYGSSLTNVTGSAGQQVRRQLANTLNRDIDFREGSRDPDISAEASLGNSWYLGSQEQWRVGALGLIDYGNQWRQRTRKTRSAGQPDVDFDQTEETINQVSLTGSLNLGVAYGEDHSVEATSIYLRNTDDEASLRTRNNFNFRREDGRQLRYYGIRYEERELELYQLRGSHTLGEDTLSLFGLGDIGLLNAARDLNFSWYYSDATATSDIPNQVTVSGIDEVDPDTGRVLSTAVREEAGTFSFTDLEDQVESYGWSLSKPFTLGDVGLTLSGGQDQSKKARRYLQTALNVRTQRSGSFLIGTPGDVLSDENLLDPANGFTLSRSGIGSESYLAAERIDAAFAKFDLNWRETWRLAGGVRWENHRQLSVPIDQYSASPVTATPEQLESWIRDEDDYYPSLALTYMTKDFWAEDFQLRLGWSQTVARPDLREVAPSIYIDPLNDARVIGNPELVSADVTNVDLRAEWFFAGGDNFTVSLFYKDLKNPIETVQGGGTDNDLSFRFINAESAELYGIEVETLKSLGFLADRLGDWTDAFFVAGNVTWSDSELTVGSGALNMTNNERRMTQHADWVANIQLGFDAPNRIHSATLVYNFVGERLFFAGVGGGADAFEQPFNSLDLTYSFYPTEALTFKLRAQNVLDEKTEVKRGDVVTLEQDIGVTLKLDASYRF